MKPLNLIDLYLSAVTPIDKDSWAELLSVTPECRAEAPVMISVPFTRRVSEDAEQLRLNGPGTAIASDVRIR